MIWDFLVEIIENMGYSVLGFKSESVLWISKLLTEIKKHILQTTVENKLFGNS